MATLVSVADAGSGHAVRVQLQKPRSRPPFWMFGQGAFDAGDRSANVSMSYAMGGGFAGQFGTGAAPASWGMVTVMFADCTTMQFDFQANSGLPADVPQGSGSRTWTRLTTINGLGCD